MELCDFVVPEAILPGLTVKSKADAIRGMVESLTACGRIDTAHSEGIISAILKREELGSTGIGNGVAVPHTKHPAVDRLTATVALSEEGVDFASLDGEAVHILFLLISPPDLPGDHLRGDIRVGFYHENGGEPPAKRRVPFDGSRIFDHRGGADTGEFASR